MYAYHEIRHVHAELTTRCNAACPMCARNARGVTAPGLPLTELRLADVRQIFPEPFVARLEAFDFCGAYGEPAAARDVIEIVSYLRKAGPGCAITLYTNGGLRTPAWWERLARALGAPARVVFAIDGIGETNGVYRRRVRFETVIENARAFIRAGGTARWEFLAFRHNEHQVDEARALAAALGFDQFSVKKTGRFLEPTYDHVPEFRDHHDLSRFPVFDEKSRVVGYLEPPLAPGLVNETVLHRDRVAERHGSLEALFDRTPIRCRVLDTSSVFVSAEGYAFPCCWTYVQATRPALYGLPDDADRQMYDLVHATGGFNAIDARRVGLHGAVASPLFAAIESSWACGSVRQGRLRVCARACGLEFPAYFDQFSSDDLLPRSLQPGRAAPHGASRSLPVIQARLAQSGGA